MISNTCQLKKIGPNPKRELLWLFQSSELLHTQKNYIFKCDTWRLECANVVDVKHNKEMIIVSTKSLKNVCVDLLEISK